MGRIELKEDTFQKWVEDHMVEKRYVVFFDYSGLGVVFWVLPATKAWQFATLNLTTPDSRKKLEQILEEKGVKFFNADVEWKFGRVRFWSWKEFAAFCKFYLPQRRKDENLLIKDYEGYYTASEEIILLPKVSSRNLINFYIRLNRTNKPEETPDSFLKNLNVPYYPVAEYTWSADTAQATSIN